jgi:hypothetical protein
MWLRGMKRAGFDRAILQEDVAADHEDGIGNAFVPLDPLGAGNVRARVDVPRIANVERSFLPLRSVPPRGIRHDVTILAEERFDHFEEAGVRHSPLRGSRAVQGLVAKVGVVLFGRTRHAHVRTCRLEQLREFSPELADLVGRKDG